MNKKVLTTAGAGLALLAIVVLAVTQLSDGSGPRREADVAEQEGPPAATGPAAAIPPNEGDALIGVEVRDAASAGGGATIAGAGGAPGEPVALPQPQETDRKIVRNATIGLGVEDVGAAVQSVESIAVGAGGFVSSSSVFIEEPPQPLPLPEEGRPPEQSEPPERTQTASVSIRVPAAAYASVMSQLRGIAKELVSENSQASDVSEEFADLEARMRTLQATEARYLELLAKAETIPDILSLQDRLNSVRLEIETTQGRINLLNNLSDLATITVQLRPFVPPVEPPAEQGWAEEAAQGAWERSQDVMQVLGTVGIVTGVVLAWLAVPALAVVVGWRLLGPRRGEA